METFKSLPELLDYFKDEKTCIKYYEQLRWNGNPVCPFCESKSETRPYKTNRGYKCSNSDCHKKFTVKVGTIFENSKIPFRIWFGAIYLATTHKKGISSVQLSIDLNITQKTAWFVLHRIREMLKLNAPEMLDSEKMVETDETYIGGKESNKHAGKRQSEENPSLSNDGTPYVPKKMVLGIIERHGKVVLKHIPDTSQENIVGFIEKKVPEGNRIISDEHTSYFTLSHRYSHNTVKHSSQIYVEGDNHTNTIENFWSVLKRGIYGIYHQVSAKHLERYLNEFATRFNSRKLSSNDRFNTFLTKSEGRLLYKNLIAND